MPTSWVKSAFTKTDVANELRTSSQTDSDSLNTLVVTYELDSNYLQIFATLPENDYTVIVWRHVASDQAACAIACDQK